MGSAATAQRGGVADVAAYAARLIDAAAALPRAGLELRRLTPFGIAIDAWFSDPSYAAMAAENVASLPVETRGEDATLLLLDARSLGWEPPEPLARDYLRPDFNAAIVRSGLRASYLPAPTMWQVWSPGRRLGVQLVARPGGTPPWESGGPLRTFIHWALPENARLCHAGTVGTGGRGVLLVGAGGSGKSGTTLAGIAAGLDSVGDDYCIVSAGGDAVEARPVFRMLKQDPAGFRRVFGPEADFGPLNWQGKWEIHGSRLPRSPFVDRMAVAAIVMPRVAHLPRCEVRAIAPTLALRAFMPSNVTQLPDGEAEGVRFTAGLCRQLPTFELLLSSDRDDIAGAIAALLDRLP
ncbi:MAG: serine kinase [Bauldia sp.]